MIDQGKSVSYYRTEDGERVKRGAVVVRSSGGDPSVDLVVDFAGEERVVINVAHVPGSGQLDSDPSWSES